MATTLKMFFVVAVLFRVGTLIISFCHERLLKQAGAVEYGAGNSAVLACSHGVFYLAAFLEGSIKGAKLDLLAGVGLAIYVAGAIVLLTVMHLLGRFWTIKLLLARDHVLVTHPFFKMVRHPSYYLNLLPELVGLALAMHAFVTLIAGLSIYSIPLTIRIREEEKIMKERFQTYS